MQELYGTEIIDSSFSRTTLLVQLKEKVEDFWSKIVRRLAWMIFTINACGGLLTINK